MIVREVLKRAVPPREVLHLQVNVLRRRHWKETVPRCEVASRGRRLTTLSSESASASLSRSARRALCGPKRLSNSGFCSRLPAYVVCARRACHYPASAQKQALRTFREIKLRPPSFALLVRPLSGLTRIAKSQACVSSHTLWRRASRVIASYQADGGVGGILHFRLKLLRLRQLLHRRLLQRVQQQRLRMAFLRRLRRLQRRVTARGHGEKICTG